MRFFTIDEDTTPDDLRRRYRTLCKRYHPDKGGSDKIQALINEEYKQALEQLSEMATRNDDSESFEQIMQMLQYHISKMCAELKEPIIRRYVPVKYHGLAFELAKLIEGKV